MSEKMQQKGNQSSFTEATEKLDLHRFVEADNSHQCLLYLLVASAKIFQQIRFYPCQGKQWRPIKIKIMTLHQHSLKLEVRSVTLKLYFFIFPILTFSASINNFDHLNNKHVFLFSVSTLESPTIGERLVLLMLRSWRSFRSDLRLAKCLRAPSASPPSSLGPLPFLFTDLSF